MARTSELGSAGFDAARLTLARRGAGLLKKDLAEDVGVTPGAISQYENGSVRPGPDVEARLALRLGHPINFFHRRESITSALATTAHFRSLRAASQRERDMAFARAVMAWELAAVVENWVQLPSVNPPPDGGLSLSSPRSAVDRYACEVRRHWGVGGGPIQDTVRLAELNGILVTRLPIGSERVHAFSAAFPRRPVIVLSADRDRRAMGRMDLAHELGHLFMHHDEAPGVHAVEKQAFAFASSLLIPDDVARDLLPRRIDLDHLVELKQAWGISVQALLYRSKELRLFSESTFKRAMVKIGKLGWRRVEPGDSEPAEVPSMLHKSLELLSSRDISLVDVADAASLPAGLVESIAARS